MKKIRSKAHNEGGFTLIEVLISMLIFSFGILGLIGMQARAIQVSYDAEDRMHASLMADDIIATMWENSTTQVPSASITSWNTRIAAALPSGAGTVSTPDSLGMVTIKITWKAPSRRSTDASSQYTTQFIMPPAL